MPPFGREANRSNKPAQADQLAGDEGFPRIFRRPFADSVQLPTGIEGTRRSAIDYSKLWHRSHVFVPIRAPAQRGRRRRRLLPNASRLAAAIDAGVDQVRGLASDLEVRVHVQGVATLVDETELPVESVAHNERLAL